MSEPLQVLIVEDSPDDADLVVDVLAKAGFSVKWERVETAGAMRQALSRRAWDIVLCDYTMPHLDAPGALAILRESRLDIPFIIISGTVGEEVAVEAMRNGAHDYVMKDRLVRLPAAVTRELREAHARRERRMMETELIASESRYRRLFEASRDGILIINAGTGVVVDANPFLIGLLGRSREELVGKRLWEISGFRALVADATAFAELCGHETVHFEDRAIVAANGRRLAIEFVSTVYAVDHHTVMQCNLRDITDRKQAELALQQSQEKLRGEEARFRALVEKSFEAVSVLDVRGHRIYASPSTERVLGYPTEELIGRSAFDFVHPDDRRRTGAAFAALVREPGGAASIEVRILRRDGAARWFEVTGTNLLHIPSVRGIVINYREITERKEAESALRRSEAELKEAQRIALVGSWQLDVATGRVTWTEELYRMFGLDPTKPAPDYAAQQKLFAPESWRALDAAVRRTRETGDPYELELVMIHPDGQPGWMLARGEATRSADGVVVGLHGTAQDITERKKIEALVRQSEERFRNLTENISDWIWEVDAQGNYTYVSPRVRDLLGYEPEELLGQSVLMLMPASEAARLEPVFRKVADNRQPLVGVENINLHKDGHPVIIETSAMPIFDANGTWCGYRGIDRDITERKEVEKKLELFRALIERTTDAIEVVEPGTGRILDVNETACRMLGYTRDELLGLTIFDLDPHADPASYSRLGDSLKKAGSATIEGVHRRKDGSVYPVEVSLSQVTLDRDYGVTIVRDISERKLAERSLRREQALFHSLVTAIPDNVYFKDRQSRFVQINDAMAKRSGLANAAAAVGKTDDDIFTSEHARQAFADEQRIMETGVPMIDVEEKETWPDGRITWVSSTKVPLRDTDGRITGLVGISRDITERKNLEARYLQAQKMEAFGQLAGGVAHDFNNILGVILMQINLLQLESGLTGKLVSGLAELERYALRGAGLTRQLLLFSRRQSMEARGLDLRVVLEDASKMLRRVLGEHITYELVAVDKVLWVEADPGMIEQVLMNLCINARDAMPNGGRLTVDLRSEVRTAPPAAGGLAGEYCCLEVSDTGSGMDEATKARIFEPFFTTKPAGKGTGLGLATVYGIVRQHRGWIEVTSAPGAGTTFRIFLPLKEGAAAVSGTTGTAPITGGHESVLVVEDEPNLRAMVCLALSRGGYRVREAAHGPEALRKWEEEGGNFDLLLADFLMPEGMTGVQLATQLIRAKAGLKVVIMTGYAPGSPTLSSPWPAGTVRLNKPFDAIKLLQMVRDCLDAKVAR
ncbi:MAG TPA: PAS domain S-box protein [Lacunisphaera sp.]|nr:PAS domain S-box protein [Lacunisphaera sp.]